MKRTIIAIDPGKAGGIAYQHDNDVPACFPMPETEGDIINRLRSIAAEGQQTVCFIEDMVKHTGKALPASSIIVYGKNWGFLAGVVQTLCIRLEVIPPKTWQKELGLGASTGLKKTEWKNRLKQKAQQLYPITEGDVTLKTSDALLLLEYGKRKQATANQ